MFSPPSTPRGIDQKELLSRAQTHWSRLFTMLSRSGKVPHQMEGQLSNTVSPGLLEALNSPLPPGVTFFHFYEDVLQCLLDSKVDLSGKFGQDILASVIRHVAQNDVLLPYSVHDDLELSSRIGAEKFRQNIENARAQARRTVLTQLPSEMHVDDFPSHQESANEPPAEQITPITLPERRSN